ncbi:MAG: hypothetical protein ABW019_16340 [Chitinophagaceae bacterium]
MKWQTVTSTIGYSVYALWNNGRKIVTLAFNRSMNTARIEYADERRVFMIRKEGFLKNKTVLRNEYGIRIAHTGTENKEDFIVLDNERFFYSPAGEKDSSVTIYKQSKDQPLAVCELDVEEGSDMSVAGRSSQEATRSSLLLTLCWYLFQPVKATPAEGYLVVPEYSLG